MKDGHLKDAAQGVAEDVPQDVAQDLAFGARAARRVHNRGLPPAAPHPNAPQGFYINGFFIVALMVMAAGDQGPENANGVVLRDLGFIVVI